MNTTSFGETGDVYGDAGYLGIDKREEFNADDSVSIGSTNVRGNASCIHLMMRCALLST